MEDEIEEEENDDKPEMEMEINRNDTCMYIIFFVNLEIFEVRPV